MGDSRTFGPANGAWKGGRTLASNGYKLVRVPGHHLADVRGYVYEHRLVAEKILGRPLLPAEVVHHRNGVKTDNRPENLEVVASRHHYAVHHRTAGKHLRLPGEPNPLVECECGCGLTFRRYDGAGRPRRFLSGHNFRRRTVPA